MMNCNDFLKQVSDFLDGEASDSNTRMINAHLSGCDDCREIFRRLSASVKAVKKLPKVKASNDFQMRLQAQFLKEAELNDRKSISRFSQSIGSIPVKPVFATLTAAAAISALSIVIHDNFLDSNKDESPLILPKLSVPPRPGQTHSTIPLQRSYMSQQASVPIGVPADTTSYKNPYDKDMRSNSEQVLRNLRSRTQTAKSTKGQKRDQN